LERYLPAPNANFIAIAAGRDHSLALRADGSIVAWGWNAYGQTNVPAPNTGFVAIAAGEYHSMGLKADGSIVAWGDNGGGQTNVPAPNSDFIGIAAGIWQSLGLKADGSIVALGCGVPHDNYGQCKVPSPNTGLVTIAAGEYHNLAIRRVTGDADGDGDVDRADFAALVDYLDGPFVVPQLGGWQFFDVDTDDDVDLRDLAVWQNAFTGD
jgi:hypothetical protein